MSPRLPLPGVLTGWMSTWIWRMILGLKRIHQLRKPSQNKLTITLAEALRGLFRCPDPPWHWAWSWWIDSWDNTIKMSWCQRIQSMNLGRILLKPVFLSPIRISFQTTIILKMTVMFLNQKMRLRMLTLIDSSLLSTSSWLCVSAPSFLGIGISVKWILSESENLHKLWIFLNRRFDISSSRKIIKEFCFNFRYETLVLIFTFINIFHWMGWNLSL